MATALSVSIVKANDVAVQRSLLERPSHAEAERVPPSADRRRHHPECQYVTCECNGAGLFAQLAALDGDDSAAERLSPPVYAALAAERARRQRRRSHRRPAP